MSVITTQKTEYQDIHLDSLRIDTVLEFDLYINNSGSMILFRSASLPFTEATREKLLENNVTRLYISSENRLEYQKYIENNIRHIINDPKIDENTKSGIIYESTALLVRDIMHKPTLGKNIKRSQAMVESTVNYILKGKSTFHSLLQVMSFNYSTYTHSVNVCTISLALAQHLGINNKSSLNKLGTGALLHDVGKTKVPESILNKHGRLSEAEMKIVKKHPQWGFEILHQTDLMSAESYYPVIQHHERADGSGYPHGVAANDIHTYSKIVAIADVFDAMTTQRVYRDAVGTFPAIREMFTLSGQFDRDLLEQFTRLLGPSASK
jgi:putative nucleotidyltransferase with HDIG domain